MEKTQCLQQYCTFKKEKVLFQWQNHIFSFFINDWWNIFYSVIFLNFQAKPKSSRGGLGLERWSDNRLHSAPVDQILLGVTIPAMSMFYVYMVHTATDTDKYK